MGRGFLLYVFMVGAEAVLQKHSCCKNAVRYRGSAEFEPYVGALHNAIPFTAPLILVSVISCCTAYFNFSLLANYHQSPTQINQTLCLLSWFMSRKSILIQTGYKTSPQTFHYFFKTLKSVQSAWMGLLLFPVPEESWNHWPSEYLWPSPNCLATEGKEERGQIRELS